MKISVLKEVRVEFSPGLTVGRNKSVRAFLGLNRGGKLHPRQKKLKVKNYELQFKFFELEPQPENGIFFPSRK